MNWNEELARVCHEIKTEYGSPGWTFGTFYYPHSYLEDSGLLDLIPRLAPGMMRTEPFVMDGLYGESIDIDPGLPIISVSAHAFEWLYPLYERAEDGSVYEVPNEYDRASSLELNIAKGTKDYPEFVDSYSIYLAQQTNDLEVPDTARLGHRLFITECAETGYEGHQLESIQIGHKQALEFIKTVGWNPK